MKKVYLCRYVCILYEILHDIYVDQWCTHLFSMKWGGVHSKLYTYTYINKSKYIQVII